MCTTLLWKFYKQLSFWNGIVAKGCAIKTCSKQRYKFIKQHAHTVGSQHRKAVRRSGSWHRKTLVICIAQTLCHYFQFNSQKSSHHHCQCCWHDTISQLRWRRGNRRKTQPTFWQVKCKLHAAARTFVRSQVCLHTCRCYAWLLAWSGRRCN